MRRLGTSLSLSILGILGAVLPGCPVWPSDSGPSRDGGIPTEAGPLVDAGTPDTGPQACTSDANCPSGEYCNAGICTPSALCTGATADCPTGQYCDGRSTCVPGCDATDDCAAVNASFVCNTATHACEPPTCADDAACPSGQVCVSGSCRDSDSLCRFNYECGGGAECVDGRCLTTCGGAVSCPAGQSCTNGYCQYPTGDCNGVTCNAGEACTNGTCLAICTSDTTCGAGNFCDNGVCRVDDRRPAPFCTPPANGCNASTSVCVDGVCRIACPAMARDGSTNRDRACQEVDFNFTRCDTTISPAICRYQNELTPQCQRSQDCATGQTCINAFCR